MWKEKLWQVFLVVILGFVLTMCNRSASNNNSSNSGTLNADGTTTVTVSSLPSVTLANAGPSAISHTMLCLTATYPTSSSSTIRYSYCDASDDSISSGGITHDAAHAAGWKLVGSGCSSAYTSQAYIARCVLFHK